jgi:NDP-sugar pyrophosphorylase family protein
MKAFVLAAGKGTRLLPLTLERPKPAVPIGLRPLAGFAIEHLVARGATRIVLNAHHRADVLEATLRESGHLDSVAAIVREDVLLGTGGGLRNAWSAIDPGDAPLVVVNGDTLFQPDVERALAVHEATNAIATMVVRSDARARELGAVEVRLDATGAAGRVGRLLGKPETEEPLRTFMFSGTHVISARAFADLPENGCIVRHSYRRWIDRGEIVSAVVDEGPWRDVGTLSAYLDANMALAGSGVLSDPSARIESSALAGVVVGRAHIAQGVSLRRVVVWDGAVVTGSLENAVVTPSAVVPVEPVSEPSPRAGDTPPS